MKINNPIKNGQTILIDTSTRRYKNDHYVYERMLNIISHQERQIKIIMKFHCTPTGTAVIIKTDNKHGQWWCVDVGALIHSWWGYTIVQILWEIVKQFFKGLLIYRYTIWFRNSIPRAILKRKHLSTQKPVCKYS